MKENFRYQMRVYIEAVLIMWALCTGTTFVFLIFGDTSMTKSENLGAHFYGFISGIIAVFSLVTHSIVHEILFQLSITFGNTRKKWFIVSVIYKIIFAIILSLGSLFLAFLVSRLIMKQSLMIQGEEVLFSFIMILLFSFIGDVSGVLIRHIGMVKFFFLLGGVIGIASGVGYLTRDKIGTLYEDLLSRPIFTVSIITVIFILLILMFWRLIRKQEVKI